MSAVSATTLIYLLQFAQFALLAQSCAVFTVYCLRFITDQHLRTITSAHLVRHLVQLFSPPSLQELVRFSVCSIVGLSVSGITQKCGLIFVIFLESE